MKFSGQVGAEAEKERVFAVQQIFQLIPQKEPVNARRRRNTIGYAKVNQNTIIYTKKPSSHPLHGVQSHRNICNWSGLAGKSILQKPNRAGEPTETLRIFAFSC